ncbi:transposase, Mutator family domain protein [Mycobacterium sp. MAC_080597_8934]|nr:transposase, Mutator family domain protein [Mycobacterium sp. MAC_080597_8934]
MVKRPRITTERNIAMALDQSALLEVLDALRTADAGERITQAAETIYQALIDAELTAGGIVKTCGLGCFRRPPFRLIRPVRVV